MGRSMCPPTATTPAARPDGGESVGSGDPEPADDPEPSRSAGTAAAVGAGAAAAAVCGRGWCGRDRDAAPDVGRRRHRTGRNGSGGRGPPPTRSRTRRRPSPRSRRDRSRRPSRRPPACLAGLAVRRHPPRCSPAVAPLTWLPGGSRGPPRHGERWGDAAVGPRGSAARRAHGPGGSGSCSQSCSVCSRSCLVGLMVGEEPSAAPTLGPFATPRSIPPRRRWPTPSEPLVDPPEGGLPSWYGDVSPLASVAVAMSAPPSSTAT